MKYGHREEKIIEMMKEHGFQQSVEAEQEFTRVRRNYCERQMFQEGDERKCEGSEFV